jgi:hypothetical protein
LADKLKT